jgi:hypothetical protein
MGTVDQFAELWTEPRPAPLVMTDTEILDWLNEWCDGYVYTYPTKTHNALFTLYCVDMKVSGQSLREAVQLAAAKKTEEN